MTYDVIDAQKRSYAENERLIRNILAPLCHVTSLASDLHILAPCGADLGRLSGAAANRSSTTAKVNDWATFKNALFSLEKQKRKAGSADARKLVQTWKKLAPSPSSVVLFRQSTRSITGAVLPGGALRPMTLQEIITLVLDDKLDGKIVPKGVGGLNNAQFTSFLKVRFDSACLLSGGTIGFSALNACLGQIESVPSGPPSKRRFTTQLRSEQVLTAPQSPLKLSWVGEELKLERSGGCKEQPVYIRVSNAATKAVIADLPVLVEDVCGANGVPTHTPTATFTASATPTATVTPTLTFTPTTTPSPTFTHTPTATFTHTPTATFTYTATPSPTSTHTPSPTFTDTATPSPTFTFTASPTFTHTATPSPTEAASLFYESDPDALAAYTERSIKSVMMVGKANSTIRLSEFLKKVQAGQTLGQLVQSAQKLRVDTFSPVPGLPPK